MIAGPMGHVPALDGIRGLAVLAVVAHHLDHLTGGYLGVDAFFVLSGFLITGLLVDEAHWSAPGRIDLARFWTRRIKRLFPALAIVLVTVVVVEAFVVTASANMPSEPLSALLYVYNWSALADGVDYWSALSTPSPLRHMWSLAIEEQFYLVWPLVVVAVFAVVRRRTARTSAGAGADAWTATAVRAVGVVAAVLAVVSIVVAQLVHDPDNTLRVYYGTDARISSILFGAVAAIVVRNLPPAGPAVQRLVGAIALLATCAVGVAWVVLSGTSPVLYRGGLVAAGVAVAFIVASLLVAPRSLLARALSIAPLRWCGLVSYGLYLWHWPIIVWLSPGRTGLDGLSLLLLRTAVIVTLTVLSYVLVEQPIRRARWGVAPTLTVAGLALVGLIVVTVAASTTVTDRIEQPAAGTRSTVPIPPPPTTMSSTPTVSTVPTMVPSTVLPAESPEATNPTDGSATADQPSTSTAAVADEGNAPPAPAPVRLMVVGDSGAYFLGEELLAVAPGGAAVLPRGTVGCGIANVGGGVYTDDGTFLADPEGCHDWPTAWAADIAAFQPTQVLLVLSWPGIGDREIDGRRLHPCDAAFDAFYAEQVGEAISVAGATGAEVIVATAPYYVGADGGAIEADRIDCLNETMTTVSSERGATVLDLAEWTCPDARCRVTADGSTLRPDGLHFAGDGGRVAAEWVLGELARSATGDP